MNLTATRRANPLLTDEHLGVKPVHIRTRAETLAMTQEIKNSRAPEFARTWKVTGSGAVIGPMASNVSWGSGSTVRAGGFVHAHGYGVNCSPCEQVKQEADKRRRQYAGMYRSLLPKVFLKDGCRCVRCGTLDDLTIDHIHPLSRGGTNDLENLQTLCRTCNTRKGARIERNPT